jgi:muramidase (phage lysozyme)
MDTTLTAIAIAMLVALAVMRARTSAQQYDPAFDVGDMVENWGDVVPASIADTIPTEDDQQTTSLIEDAFVAFTPTTYSGTGATPGAENSNLRAFLDMIAYAEGTSGPDGYRTMFGGTLMDSMADHPRKFFSFKNSRGESLKTSAAGRYQFLSRTWDELKAKLKLQDFGPASQDAAAIELIRQRGALNDVKAGRVVQAIDKVKNIWASLPGAGYAQPEKTIPKLIAAYQSAGGNVLTA